MDGCAQRGDWTFRFLRRLLNHISGLITPWINILEWIQLPEWRVAASDLNSKTRRCFTFIALIAFILVKSEGISRSA